MDARFAELESRICEPPNIAYLVFDKPFLNEADASSFEIRAIMSQKNENGKVHYKKFDSQTMNSVQQNYKVNEEEVLEMVFLLKKLRHYLPSTETVTLITDY